MSKAVGGRADARSKRRHKCRNDIFYCEIKLKERLFSDLEQDGFCKNPFFHGIVAEVPEKLRSKDGGSWSGRAVYMEDLYVMPEFRGKGIGKALMSKVAQ
ncbi:unnamed protein product, partial [Menidia menidia]